MSPSKVFRFPRTLELRESTGRASNFGTGYDRAGMNALVQDFLRRAQAAIEPFHGTFDNPLILIARHQAACSADTKAKLKVPSLALEMAELALAAFGLELRHALVHILFAAREHGVDQAGELVRGRLDRAGRVEPS